MGRESARGSTVCRVWKPCSFAVSTGPEPRAKVALVACTVWNVYTRPLMQPWCLIRGITERSAKLSRSRAVITVLLGTGNCALGKRAHKAATPEEPLIPINTVLARPKCYSARSCSRDKILKNCQVLQRPNGKWDLLCRSQRELL